MTESKKDTFSETHELARKGLEEFSSVPDGEDSIFENSSHRSREIMRRTVLEAYLAKKSWYLHEQGDQSLYPPHPVKIDFWCISELNQLTSEDKMYTVSGNRESNGGKREGAGRKRGAGAIRTQEISKAFIETNQQTPLDEILIAMTRAHNEKHELDPSNPQYRELEIRADKQAALAHS